MKIFCPKFCTLLKVGAGLGGEEGAGAGAGAGAGDCAQPKPDRPSVQTKVQIKIKDALAGVSADEACEAVTGANVEWGLDEGKFMGGHL